ncbi:MAG: hypothetical protein ChlgKO_10030 [Chlamydiales bacterium]
MPYNKPPTTIINQEGYELSWEGDHSLLFSRFDENLLFTYSEKVPEGKDDRMEVNIYLDYHPDNSIFVNGKKATAFQMNDRVEIHSGKRKITLEFTPGEGQFFGHISRHNRPSRKVPKNVFESHDWRIAIRTISRPEKTQLKVGLSEATPMA